MSLLWQERAQDGSDLERQGPRVVEGQARSSLRSFTLRNLLPGRMGWVNRDRAPSENESENDDGPKSPNLERTGAQEIPNQLPPAARTQETGIPSRTRIRLQRFPVLTRPQIARAANGEESERHVRRSRFGGSNPAELHLVEFAEDERRRRRAQERLRRKEPPKRFLFCFPWVRSRQARALILRCFVSGVFLISMLTTYLALAITKNINSSAFSILLILLIILTAIIFCHGLILLCLTLVKPKSRPGPPGVDIESNRYGQPGYAIPRQPIRVVLARDEEAAGIESETAKLKPPAYGLWRESVRVDPNRIYWQRAKSPLPNGDDGDEGGGRTTQRRPPSYASDDGIDYVVDARPRSIAPPPSSVYSRASTIDSPFTSNEVPPLPRPAATEMSGPRVVGRPGNWLIV
ncbi:hypothetical protein F5B22DRAFT_484703 [Xylaria bambusicola]|uniref:uncharacterized protein n=1 Tax=Xylaria bambusicola TaxID=326684 RepID=UPI002008071E|nr:uncharacterized protein F5B22DRAFT_484703 [Xylaria bambusicola]KAI0505993.1 hypothetical protein F5B22DRAFT_484703 [Xylaria bambusicola]